MNKIKVNKRQARYFQIRDLNSQGEGCSYIFKVDSKYSEEMIFEYACSKHTSDMQDSESRYTGAAYQERPYWRPTVKVVEVQPEIVNSHYSDTGSPISYTKWNTKRGGLKFTIVNHWIQLNNTKYNGYSFGKKLNKNVVGGGE